MRPLTKITSLLFLFIVATSALPTKADESKNLSFRGVVPARQDVRVINTNKSKSIELEVQNTSESSMKLKVRSGRSPASVSVIEPNQKPVKTRITDQGPTFVGFEAP